LRFPSQKDEKYHGFGRPDKKREIRDRKAESIPEGTNRAENP
jgi:hypothetical protein